MSAAVDVIELAAPVVLRMVGSTTWILPSTTACAAAEFASGFSGVTVLERDISSGVNILCSTKAFHDCPEARAATSPARKNPILEYWANARKLYRGLKYRSRLTMSARSYPKLSTISPANCGHPVRCASKSRVVSQRVM